MLAKEKSNAIKAIERSIANLTLIEQLWLLEHIAHQIRLKSELAAMAQDRQIQTELAQIQQEFATTDLDGLTEL